MKSILSCAIIIPVLFTSCIKPVKHLPQKRWVHTQQDEAYLYNRIQQRQTLHLTLDQAIAMALECNLELAVKAQSLELQNEALVRQMLQMLPELNVGSTLSWRNKNTGSSSESLLPNVNPAPLSVSSEQTDQLWNAKFTWNLLNFGVNYFRSKQEANRTVVSKLEYCRVAQNLILDVVKSYWTVASLQEPVAKVNTLSTLTTELKEKLKEQVAKGTLSSTQAAQQMSRILDLQIDAKKMRSSYIQSYEKIKNLLGIPSDIEVTFDVPKERTYIETLPTQQELQKIALAYRPELYQLDVQGEIHKQEINEALVKVLPEIAPFITHNYDSNRFLLYNHWTTFGGRALWNLLAIPLALQDREIARDQRRLVCNQRVLLSLGVISQVHLTHALYYDYLDQYYDSRDYLRAKQLTYELSVARREKNAIGLADYTYSLADLVLREFEAGLAYANLQGSLEQLNNTIGIPYHFSTAHRVCEHEKQNPNFCE